MKKKSKSRTEEVSNADMSGVSGSAIGVDMATGEDLQLEHEIFAGDIIDKYLEALLEHPGSFVTCLGAPVPGGVQTMPQRLEPTAPPKEITEDVDVAIIEVFGIQTNGSRMQFVGPTREHALRFAYEHLNAYTEAQIAKATEGVKSIDDEIDSIGSI